MQAIKMTDLHKRYGAQPVLRGLNLEVARGEVYGLLGPNGAGKSTLMHLLLGFLKPEQGALRVLGVAPQQARSRVGYLPERVRYHTHCTPREYLSDLGRCSNMRGHALRQRCAELLRLVRLETVADRRMSSFSKGMLQRLGIAQALLHSPELLLVDEPTSGLDPVGQQELIELLDHLRRQGLTILLCSHHVAELRALCDRVGILFKGRIAVEQRPDALGGGGQLCITTRGPIDPATAAALQSLGPQISVSGQQICFSDDDALQELVLRRLLDSGARIAELRPTHDALTELYRDVTQSESGR